MHNGDIYKRIAGFVDLRPVRPFLLPPIFSRASESLPSEPFFIFFHGPRPGRGRACGSFLTNSQTEGARLKDRLHKFSCCGKPSKEGPGPPPPPWIYSFSLQDPRNDEARAVWGDRIFSSENAAPATRRILKAQQREVRRGHLYFLFFFVFFFDTKLFALKIRRAESSAAASCDSPTAIRDRACRGNERR